MWGTLCLIHTLTIRRASESSASELQELPMTVSDAETPPVREEHHRALDVFLGKWRAEGTSYGSPDQDEREPKGNGVPWQSTHEGRWHTGDFFLVQDEKAR